MSPVALAEGDRNKLMDTTTILLIRHGNTGITDREQKPEDPLSPEGREEVEALAESLKNVSIKAFYSSPYRRASGTAEILAKGQKVEVDSRLREIPLWASPKDLLEDERRLELTKILVEAQEGIEGVLENIEENHGGETVALVCHGNIIRATLGLTLEMSLETVVRLETTTASLTVIRTGREGYRLRLFNGKSV